MPLAGSSLSTCSSVSRSKACSSIFIARIHLLRAPGVLRGALPEDGVPLLLQRLGPRDLLIWPRMVPVRLLVKVHELHLKVYVCSLWDALHHNTMLDQGKSSLPQQSGYRKHTAVSSKSFSAQSPELFSLSQKN